MAMNPEPESLLAEEPVRDFPLSGYSTARRISPSAGDPPRGVPGDEPGDVELHRIVDRLDPDRARALRAVAQQLLRPGVRHRERACTALFRPFRGPINYPRLFFRPFCSLG
jgi:hypothetical protein